MKGVHMQYFKVTDLMLNLKIVEPGHAQLHMDGCGGETLLVHLLSCGPTNGKGKEGLDLACSMRSREHLIELKDALQEALNGVKKVGAELGIEM